jgi:S-adenosylmethionine:tRNA ribosyltransferase-isomerase
MDVTDFDFDLPDELIAQEPPVARGGSRLLVLVRATGGITHTTFDRLGDHLRKGDLLVLNDTKVFPARLLGVRVPSGGGVECLLLRRLSTSQPTSGETVVDRRADGGETQEWDALMHPGQKLHPGARVAFDRDGVRIEGEVLARHFHGRRTVRLSTAGMPLDEAIERVGHIPLPPYIKRPDREIDRERYQTVYAHVRGSVAAPTAGLHFTEPLLDSLAARGIERTQITLHVGYGTFKPVRAEQAEQHVVDPEPFSVPAQAAAAINRARRTGGRVVAVGTTTARALESLVLDARDDVQPTTGETRLFIYPGHTFRLVQGLVTNFHLPKSSLLMLVAAFAGRDSIVNVYREAVERKYRFYSYGDAMLLL